MGLRLRIAHKFLHFPKGFFADVVFDTFRINLRRALGDTKCSQERKNKLMTSTRSLGQGQPFGAQLNRLTGRGVQEPFPIQPPDDAGRRDMTHCKFFGQHGDAALTGRLQKFRHSLDVILSGF